MSNSNVTIIPIKEGLPHYEKVGIYCRVSSASAAQLHSLAAQASFLTKYALKHHGWLLGDIYIDVGSGSNNNRDEYKRLLADIQQGLITLVLVKSISRFGRNVEDILTATRSIKAAGANIYFEEQEISTLSNDYELYISIYGAVAQAENQNTSENIRWAIKKRVEDGSSAIFDRPCFGYRVENKEFVIVDGEASVVRKIFNWYLDGLSIIKIKAALEKEKIPSPSGKSTWSKSTIEHILTNKKYCGFSEVWKSYFEGEETTHRVINKGGHSKVEMPQHHDAIIIPLELFNRVQDERMKRSNIEIDTNGTSRRKHSKYSSLKK